MKVRVLRIVLLLTVLVGLLSVTAAAETSGIWEYYTNYNNSLPGGMEATITGCSGSGSVAVPAKIGGYCVTAVTSGTFYNHEDVTSIRFDSNPYLELVGSFHGASNLKSVNMSSISLETLSDYQFTSCSSLTSVAFPSGLKKIGKDAFYGCSSLTNLTIPSTVETIADSTSEYYGAFASCSALKTIDLSKSKITKVPAGALYNCSALTTVKLPSTVTIVGSRAFMKCTSLHPSPFRLLSLRSIARPFPAARH